MSLAEELLADLEELEADAELGNVEESEDIEEIEEVGSTQIKSIRNLARLIDSDQFKKVLTQIDYFVANPRKLDSVYGPVEQDPEYRLIVEANNLMVDIDTEVGLIHKYCRDMYIKRFPELESLVPNALDYIKTVHFLGNDLDPTKLDSIEFLPPAVKMVVSVTASTTHGEPLELSQVDLVSEACFMAGDLVEAKLKIFDYVQSRMTFIAPNLSLIVGAPTAAKMMGAAGGLTALSKMPACNVQLLGASRKTLAGFSAASVLPHTGFIFYSELVQKMPPHFRRKAARLVSAKSTLAARIDSFHESPEGNAGSELLDEIEGKFEKWLEPPPVKEVKALPRPDDPPRRKRAGRRVRRMKEKFAVTELHRQANRVQFGQIEEDLMQTSVGYTLGSVGKAGSGKIRNPVLDTKTKASISKRLQRNLAAMNSVYGGRSTIRQQVSGTSSSVAFTSVQGLEIVNPNAAEKRSHDGQVKYFSESTGFHCAKKVKVEMPPPSAALRK